MITTLPNKQYDWNHFSLSSPSPIGYRNQVLSVEKLSLPRLVEQIDTPFYVYSTAAIEQAYHCFTDAFSWAHADICYALKANSTLGIIATLGSLGAGADVVSKGEMKRALTAGISAKRILFSGVGKTADEIHTALHVGLLQINVESFAELKQIGQIACHLGQAVDIGIRVNPDIDAGTHTGISTGRYRDKFGIDLKMIREAFDQASRYPCLRPRALALHIGSQIMDLLPFEQTFKILAQLVPELRAAGYPIDRLDIGGGLGISYGQNLPPSIAGYAEIVRHTLGDLECHLLLEPGRAIVGSAGILITRVIYVKKQRERCFVILDAAMNDLLRPSLYSAYHPIIPVVAVSPEADVGLVDIVGPICESSDTFAVDRPMPSLVAGDLVAILACGAYSAVMASEYNSRPRIAEVLVKDDQFTLARRRPRFDEMMVYESIPEWL